MASWGYGLFDNKRTAVVHLSLYGHICLSKLVQLQIQNSCGSPFADIPDLPVNLYHSNFIKSWVSAAYFDFF